MYTEHKQNTDVQSLDNISQQNLLNVHRTWTEHRYSVSRYYITTKLTQCTQMFSRSMYTEHRCSVSSLWPHHNSSHFLRLTALSSHCAGSCPFITNPTQHSPSWEANKNSASQEIRYIYVIWRFTITLQRPAHSTGLTVSVPASYENPTGLKKQNVTYWDFS